MDRGGEERPVGVGGRVNVTRERVGKRWRPLATSDGAGNPLDKAQADPAGDNACASSSLRTPGFVSSPRFNAIYHCLPLFLVDSFVQRASYLNRRTLALSIFPCASYLFVTLNPAFSRRAVTTRLNKQLSTGINTFHIY